MGRSVCLPRAIRGMVRPSVLDHLPRAWIAAYLFVLGACVGSFLNVVIARLPQGLSIVRPRSRCPRCESPIAWYDNVPLVSFVLLRARCRHCRARIAARYLMVELLTACLFVALFARFDLSFELAVWLPLSAVLLAIVFLDIDHWWVPDLLVFPSLALVLAAAFLPDRLGWLPAVLGLAPALFIWGVAWLFALVTRREGLGLGDVKLLALLGVALGPIDAMTVLLLAALQGSVIGVMVLLTGGHRGVEPPPDVPGTEGSADDEAWTPPPRAIPFGPFLVLGALEVVLLPDVFGTAPERITTILLGWLS